MMEDLVATSSELPGGDHSKFAFSIFIPSRIETPHPEERTLTLQKRAPGSDIVQRTVSAT